MRARLRWHGGEFQSEAVLRQMEGLLAKLRDTPPEQRPEATVHSYLAKHLGTSVQTTKARIEDAKLHQHRDADADYFLDIVYRIGNELSESLVGKTFAIARDPSNRNAFNAQKWLLPKIDPDVFGEQSATKSTSESSSAISDIPQEAWDEATPEETAQIEEIERTISNELLKLEHIVRRLQQRVANKRVQDVQDLY